MDVHRFFCPSIPSDDETVQLTADEARHAARVLRVRPGDAVALLDGRGRRAEARVEDVRPGRRQDVVLCRIASSARATPPVHRFRLCVAPPRGKEVFGIIRQAAELGVWRISPVLCDLGVADPGQKTAGPHAVSEAVAALKQSGNPFLPTLDPARPFAQVVAECPPPGYFGDVPRAGSRAPERVECPPGDVSLWIGPEGGFSAAEQQMLLERGYQPVSLGRWTLRVATAVTALAGWLAGALHDHTGSEDT